VAGRRTFLVLTSRMLSDSCATLYTNKRLCLLCVAWLDRQEINMLLYFNIYVCLCPEQQTPQWAMASSFTRFLDHTQRRTTVGRTPLVEWSARRRDLWQQKTLTTDKYPWPPVGFEPTVSAGERPQTNALDCAATETGISIYIHYLFRHPASEELLWMHFGAYTSVILGVIYDNLVSIRVVRM
jgi:hypothetical protein